jgi:hypothetical protein
MDSIHKILERYTGRDSSLAKLSRGASILDSNLASTSSRKVSKTSPTESSSIISTGYQAKEHKMKLPGSKILLMGESGTGKTYSLRTLIQAGITPCVIFTEPGMETLADLPDEAWHYKYMPPRVEGWDHILDMAKKVNVMNFESLAKMQDPNKRKYTAFLDLINQCNNFEDQHGNSLGDVASWGTDKALVIDSLSALSDMVMQLTTGGKVTRAMQDWMVAQNTLEMFINQLVSSLSCWFVLIAHIEREKDELTGGTSVMVSTLGRKLAPKLPKYFSDVIQSVREGDKFYWDTAGYSVAVKARNLPIGSKLQPTFVQIVNTWTKRGGELASPTITNLKEVENVIKS